MRIARRDEIDQGLRSIELDRPRPTIVVIGGAGGLEAEQRAHLEPLFSTAIAPTAQRLDAYVLDGGTEVGVMQLMGAARAAIGGTFPLIGVFAESTVALPGNDAPADAPGVDPHHSHLVVVPGHEWGDEGPWLALVASALSVGRGSVTVLVNGGEVALADVGHSVAEGRRVLVVAGSGRVADELTAAVRRESVEERARALAASGLVTSVDALGDSQELSDAIEAVVGAGH